MLQFGCWLGENFGDGVAFATLRLSYRLVDSAGWDANARMRWRDLGCGGVRACLYSARGMVSHRAVAKRSSDVLYGVPKKV